MPKTETKSEPFTHVPVRITTFKKIDAIRDQHGTAGWFIVDKAIDLYLKHIKFKDETVAPKAGKKSVASAA